MKNVEKLDCDTPGCGENASTRINREDSQLLLCSGCEQDYVENLREKIIEKYEGKDKQEIVKDLVQNGESLL